MLTGMRFGEWTALDEVHYKGNRRYVTCRCSCGFEKDLAEHGLLNGYTKQCFRCARKSSGKLRRKDGAGWNTYLYRYQSNAKNRSHSFELTKEEFIEICLRDCFYCGDKPIEIQIRSSQMIQANGIDRWDNTLGYTIDNSVACCSVCNKLKNTMNPEVFMSQVEKIAKHNLLRK